MDKATDLHGAFRDVVERVEHVAVLAVGAAGHVPRNVLDGVLERQLRVEIRHSITAGE